MPRRPDHPDFWLISQILIDHDAQAESGITALDIIARTVSPDVAAYVAGQRALRMLAAAGAGAGSDLERARLAVTWLDGFMAGTAFQARKNRQEPS